jgi:3-methyladenine DNA glycosylase AlkD
MMIAEPSAMTAKELDQWAKGITSYGLGDMFARHILSKSKFAKPKFEQWTVSSNELLAYSAFTTLACYAMENQDEPDAYFERWLEQIEKGIHKAKNRVRHAMNGALIAIGIRNPRLQKLAIAAAGRIGKVTVDHGDTACQTPDAAAYIKKAAARAAAK